MSDFNDLVGDLAYGEMSFDETDDEQDNRDEAPAADPTEESPAEDKPTPDPDSEDTEIEPDTDEVEDQPSDDEDVDAPEGGDEDDAAEDEDEDKDAEPTVEIDGEQVPLSEVKQWRDGAMMREDYTRKTQELSEREKSWQEQIQEQRALVEEVTSDQYMQKFLSAHPEAMRFLLEDPEATRDLLGNKEAVDAFWEDYELISENPRLAERLSKPGADEDEEVSEEVRQQRVKQATYQVASALKNAVAEVGKEYDGVDPDDVENWLIELGGLDPKKANEATESQVIGAFANLYQMIFRQTNEGLKIDPKLIRDRYEVLASRVSDVEDEEASKAEEHNRKVDEALEEQGGPPATKGGGAPTAGSEPVESPDSFREAVDDILGS